MDYYSILGVGSNASPEEIKRAYRKLAMKHHPDRTGGDDTRFKQINEAYDTLKDPAKRQQYDNPQPKFNTSHMNQSPFGAGGFEDIFANMFRQPHMRPRQPKNNDITVAADVDLADVISGKDLIISYRLGSGRNETVEVTIPPGAKNGDAVKFQNLGDDSNPRFPRGDLVVRIRVRKHKTFQREGNNLITTYTADVFDLILGTVIIIETPDGRKVRLTIPKGTRPNQTFSIPQYGLPDLNTRQKGHLYVKIEASIPSIRDPKILAKLQELRDEINLQS
jgi:curved DNA-binding protein